MQLNSTLNVNSLTSEWKYLIHNLIRLHYSQTQHTEIHIYASFNLIERSLYLLL